MATLDQRLETYKTDGFTIFEKVFGETQMELWKEKHQELSAAHNGQTWFGNTLELAPELMWPAVSHPMILEFIEKVMGPFVQLDNLTLAAFPSIESGKGGEGEFQDGIVIGGRTCLLPMRIIVPMQSMLFHIYKTSRMSSVRYASLSVRTENQLLLKMPTVESRIPMKPSST